MKLTLGQLRCIINEVVGGSDPNEAYDRELVDDPSLKKKSVYVPDDVKRHIGRWFRKMGLASNKKKRNT